jgi:hypothetical protein
MIHPMTYSKGNLFNAGVNVKDSGITGANNVLVFENGELGFENIGGPDGLLDVTNNKSILNFLQ